MSQSCQTEVLLQHRFSESFERKLERQEQLGMDQRDFVPVTYVNGGLSAELARLPRPSFCSPALCFLTDALEECLAWEVPAAEVLEVTSST